jgi:hypothetical protein
MYVDDLENLHLSILTLEPNLVAEVAAIRDPPDRGGSAPQRKNVESYQAHIKEKLCLRSARELVQHAIQWNGTEQTA